MSIYSQIEHILAYHTCLTQDEIRLLKKTLEAQYTSEPLSVQVIYEITCLFHETNGIRKVKQEK